MILGRGDVISEGVVMLREWDSCKTALVPLSSLSQTWVSMVGLAPTSTTHSPYISGTLRFYFVLKCQTLSEWFWDMVVPFLKVL